jgi:hypothetical protein
VTDAVGRVTRQASRGDGVLWWIGWALAQAPEAPVVAPLALDLAPAAVTAVEAAGRPRWTVRLRVDEARARSYEVRLVSTPSEGDGVEVTVRADVLHRGGGWVVDTESAWDPEASPAVQAALAEAGPAVSEASVAPATGSAWSLAWGLTTEDPVVAQLALSLWEGLRGLTVVVPAARIGPGSTWTARRELALPWGGTLQEVLSYELVGRDGPLLQLRVARRSVVSGEHGYEEDLTGALWLDTRWWLPTAARLAGTVTSLGPDDVVVVDQLAVTVASVEADDAR